MFKYVLDNALTLSQRQAGLWLCEAPAKPDTLNLIYLGSCVGSYDSKHVLLDQIRTDAEEVMRLVTR